VFTLTTPTALQVSASPPTRALALGAGLVRLAALRRRQR